jgi:long-chain fatty acid transport protein
MERSQILTLTGTVLASGTLWNQSAQAGGIGLYEISSPDVGLASAGYAARAQDASTVFKNPAGMSLLDGPQIQGGAQLLYGSVKFSPSGSGANAKSGGGGGNAVGALPGASFFYSQTITDKVAVGFGSFSYFGLAEKYDDNWTGRYYIQKGTLLGMSLMPAASVKVNDWLSIGAGLNAMYGYLDTEVAINNSGLIPGDGKLKLNDTQWGFGGIGGILITPREGTRIGVTYISPVKLDFSDKPTYENAPVLSSLPKFNHTLNLGVTVPQSVMVGLYQELNAKWALVADVGWQQWSEFGKVDVRYDGPSSTSLTKDLNYNDTWHGALGAIYNYSDAWRFTGGVAYDTSAVDDQDRTVTLPMGSAYRVGLGTDWRVRESLTLNVAYEFMWCGDMSVNQTGGPMRGDVVGAYDNAWFSFLTVNATWRF